MRRDWRLRAGPPLETGRFAPCELSARHVKTIAAYMSTHLHLNLFIVVTNTYFLHYINVNKDSFTTYMQVTAQTNNTLIL